MYNVLDALDSRHLSETCLFSKASHQQTRARRTAASRAAAVYAASASVIERRLGLH